MMKMNEYLMSLVESKKEMTQEEYSKTKFDAKKIANAIKKEAYRTDDGNIRLSKSDLNSREKEMYDDVRDALVRYVLGKNDEELTEGIASVLRELGFKIGKKIEDESGVWYKSFHK